MPGTIVAAAVMPHGADLLLAGGDGPAPELVTAMRELAAEIVAAKPDVLVVIDPHGPAVRPAMGLYGAPLLSGDLAGYGLPDVEVFARTDLQMEQLTAGLCQEAGIPLVIVDRYCRQPLSQGVVVPLHLLRQAGLPMVPVLVVTPSDLPLAMHHQLGQVLGFAAQRSGRRVAVIASAELSHRHTEAPEQAAAYDSRVCSQFAAGDWPELLAPATEALRAAGECGLRALSVLLGLFRPEAIAPGAWAYAVHAGVGRLVGRLTVLHHPDTAPDSRPRRPAETLADLAMQALYCHLAKQETIQADGPVQEAFGARQGGVFVVVYRDGIVKASTGTVVPMFDNVCDETIHNIIALLGDPRLTDIRPEVLPQLSLSVHIVGPSEPVDSLDLVDPKRYGLIAHTGFRLGVLLPNAEGIDTPQAQMETVMRKAAVLPGEPLWLLRFPVETSNSWDPKPLVRPGPR